MSGVVSKKLKFKGDKPKKKKRAHRDEDETDQLAALAASDPRGWMFPEDLMEVTGPSFIILPTEPLSCLAWNPGAQKVYAAPLDIPQAPEGMDDLSPAEILQSIEPTDINHVWVISRLSGSEGVISLRSASGTFLTASPSGQLSAATPSRGPLELFTPHLSAASSSSSSSSPFPVFSLQTNAEKYLSASMPDGASGLGAKNKIELRADGESIGEFETLRVKCQREEVLKVRIRRAEESEGGKGKRRLLEGGPEEGSFEDELRRNKEAQTWGAGRTVISNRDRKDVKKARKEGRLAEAMLDRRAAMKSDRYAK